jgi:hypothetical protein
MKYTEEQREKLEFRLEKDLQKYVAGRLREIEGLCLFNIHGDRYNVGIPDLIGCYDGKFFAIELKVKKNTPTELQKIRLADIERAGGVQGVAYTWGDVKKILKNVGLSLDND